MKSDGYMKRFVSALLAVCLLLALTSCTHTLPVPESSTPLTSSAPLASEISTSSQAMSNVYSPGVLTPPQGGNMLYPTYHTLPNEIWSDVGAYVPEVFGIINQNGLVIASPQYVDFEYYKDTTGRIQYIIVTGNKKCVVYTLDGAKYMEFEAESIMAFNGFPCLLVGLHTNYRGPGSEPNTSYTIYDLRTGKKVLNQNYNRITIIDSHTVLLRNYGKFNNHSYEYIDTYLYDLNAKPAKAVKMDGYPEGIYFGPPFADTVTRIPATDIDITFLDEVTSPVKHGYLGRDGHFVKKSEENNGVKPLINNPEDTEPYFCKGLSEDRSFEDCYFWVTQGAYQGYQDKNGKWLYREDNKSTFLED
jgi:hypothetical protein